MTAATASCSVEFEHCGEFRVRGPYSQQFKISLANAPALIVAIINAVPRHAHAPAVIDQIIAAARARLVIRHALLRDLRELRRRRSAALDLIIEEQKIITINKGER